jgi:hypothetical protein
VGIHAGQQGAGGRPLRLNVPQNMHALFRGHRCALYAGCWIANPGADDASSDSTLKLSPARSQHLRKGGSAK